MAVEPLSHEEVTQRLGQLSGWRLEDDQITCSYRFDQHLQAAGLVADIARVQDELNHHSDLTLGYNTVTVTVTTHSAGAKVTALDVELARRIEELAPGHGARPA